MKFLACSLILAMLLFPAGCAEIGTTVRVVTVVVGELFRLPIYCLRIPFQILQGLAPTIQSGMRSGAQMAPFLFFIQRRTPKRDIEIAGASLPAAGGAPTLSRARVETVVLDALERDGYEPFFAVLGELVEEGGKCRVTLIDSAFFMSPLLRDRILDFLIDNGGIVACGVTEGTAIFSRPKKGISLLRDFAATGGSIIAVTVWQKEFARLTGGSSWSPPPGEPDRKMMNRMERMFSDSLRDACSQG